MNSWMIRGVPVALAIGLLVAGCGEDDDRQGEEVTARVDIGSAAQATAPGGADAAAGVDAAATQEEALLPPFDPSAMVNGIDNPFMPLAPGSRWRYEAESDEGTEVVEIVVQGETREVMGVQCVVVRDTVKVDDVIVEDTYDWFAQDVDGNVWYMGEEVKNYKDGVFVDTKGEWEAGVDGAKPGIIMWADPQPGAPYRQELYPGKAEDMARVVGRDGKADVAAGTYTDLLMTDEWNPLDPGVVERKYYAKGVGMVLEEVVEGDPGRLELVEAALP